MTTTPVSSALNSKQRVSGFRMNRSSTDNEMRRRASREIASHCARCCKDLLLRLDMQRNGHVAEALNAER